MRFLHRKTAWGIGLAATVLATVLLVVVIAAARHHETGGRDNRSDESGETASGALAVKTITPRCDPSFVLSVQEPATVIPYYVAELDAQVAGRVELIRKAAGSSVAAGEVLAKIAVPDLDQEVVLKEAVVQQRRRELELAEKQIKIALAHKAAAGHYIEEQKHAVGGAESTRDFREKELRRLRRLIDDSGTTKQIVEERELYTQAAVADVMRAQKAVLRAEAEYQEAEGKLDAAYADIKLKQALVGVAEKDRDKAKAFAAYSEIKSSFDGVIKRRHEDPGAFLRVGERVLTVERTDIVTVTMKVPDRFAPYVSEETEAIIEMSELPGVSLRGRVTRSSPSLLNKDNDHTRLVEVDLFNGTEKEFQAFVASERAKDLKEGPLPIVPSVAGQKAAEFHRLLPGMYGEMRLVFRKLPNVFLIPSGAIVRDGGTAYVYLVKEGKAIKAPVEIQVDDQKLAKVAVLEKTPAGQVKRGLTEKDVIVYSNFGELSDGQEIESIPVDWLPQD